MNNGHYVIDPASGKFSVHAFSGGLLSALGHNPTIAIRDYSGEADFDPEAIEKSALHLKINAGSLAVTDNISDKDRREMERTMNQEVLETSKYPEIVYDSSNVSSSRAGEGEYSLELQGDLVLHGVKHHQPVSLKLTVTGDSLRAQGQFSVRQTQYGIKLVSVAGGTLKLKDELKCSFDIVARKTGA